MRDESFVTHHVTRITQIEWRVLPIAFRFSASGRPRWPMCWATGGRMGVCASNATTRAHEVSFASNDREHLVAIANVIGAKYYLKKVAPASNTYVAEFCSKEMYTDLLGARWDSTKIRGYVDARSSTRAAAAFRSWRRRRRRHACRGTPASRFCTFIQSHAIFLTASLPRSILSPEYRRRTSLRCRSHD